MTPWTLKEEKFLIKNHSNYKKSEMIKKLKRPGYSISYKAYQLGIGQKENRSTYKIDETSFDNWNEENAWVFGFIMADGHIKKGRPDRDERVLEFEIAEYDKDILENIKEILSFDGDIRTSKRNTVKLGISNKRIINKLQDLGIPVTNKTENQEWPKTLPKHLAPHLIRGIIDGDGSYYFDGSLRVQILGTEKILESIVDNSSIQYDKEKIYNRSKYGGANVSLIRVGPGNGLDFLLEIYTGATVYSERKKNKLLEIITMYTEKPSHVQNAGTFLKLRELLENL